MKFPCGGMFLDNLCMSFQIIGLIYKGVLEKQYMLAISWNIHNYVHGTTYVGRNKYVVILCIISSFSIDLVFCLTFNIVSSCWHEGLIDNKKVMIERLFSANPLCEANVS